MNRTAAYELTIIVPLYNEEDNIVRLTERLTAFLPLCRRNACVLLVNDGSTDGSAALIHEACERHPDFFYLELAQNRGLSTALKAGFDACESPLLAYLDADLQTDPEDLNLLLPHIDAHELVTGVRSGRQDSGWKKLQARIANGWRRMMTGDGASDTCCPLKILRSEAARRIPMFRGMHRFLPALVLMQGGSYAEVPVRHHPRTAGKSKYGMWNRAWTGFIDCFAFRWMRKRQIRYSISAQNLHD